MAEYFRYALWAVAVTLVVGCAAMGQPARGRDIHAGRVLAEHYCAQCHAIGSFGARPMSEAPAFRTRSERYPIETLAPRFAAGISASHPAMPHWTFDPGENEAIISYLDSIQAKHN